MRTVRITADLGQSAAQEAFGVLSDFERYPSLTDAVRSVTITAENEGKVASTWEVTFRSGVLRWSEEDDIDAQAMTIHFNQLEGDFAEFTGVWEVEPAAGGCTVQFIASFDLGMPSLGEIIDPIAEHALRENIAKILRGLFGTGIDVHNHDDDTAPRPDVQALPAGAA